MKDYTPVYKAPGFILIVIFYGFYFAHVPFI